MIEILSIIFLTFGMFWVVLAGVGIHRFDGFFYKVHIVSKGPSLSLFLILVGVMLHFQDLSTVVKSFTIITFVFLTVPLGSSLLGLCEYNRRVEGKEIHIDD
jgi:multicomponent Na+:H+ antiporter subunit G